MLAIGFKLRQGDYSAFRHMTGEVALAGYSESCSYGMPARGPEVREGMNWGIGWLRYHELLSMTVAAGDVGPVCRTCACLA